ncbi:hypothetical protein GW17_00043576 [Ensete ventricosum]|nr:hypothetical protein GW17_00043576 [Ensete ventricosum]
MTSDPCRAPQIYFSGDTLKNLEVELRRASKIKCSNCGLKGAALGCYFESCPKSFHVPCAVEISGCRWDCVSLDHNLVLMLLLSLLRVKVCMETGCFVSEEPYEVRFDVYDFTDGSKRGRLGAMEKVPLLVYVSLPCSAQKLFAGLSFRLSEHFTPSSKQSLKELVITAGGVVLEEDILIPQDPFAIEFPALCFIYNEEPPQEYDPRGLAKVKDERCEEAIDFFKKTGAQVRGHTRVLDAIAALDIRYLLMLQCLVQKHRRRRPLQWPPWKPSVLQTFAQLLARKQSPLNLWLADSHVLASTDVIPMSSSTVRKKKHY